MKLVHDVWWTFFCQEPKLILKWNGVCQTWKEWVDMLNLKQTRQEKCWIWKHVCWLGNIKCIQKWKDLDMTNINLNIRYYSQPIYYKWNYGLVKSCQCGNRELAEFMIEKGANYWNGGLEGACHGGNRELADLMIEKGANKWDRGLESACYGGNRELADLMIEKGATNTHLIDEYFSVLNI